MAATKRANPTRTRTPRNIGKPVPLVLRSSDEEPPVAREPLFSVDGKTYDIPVKVSVSQGLQYLTILMERGVGTAVIWALKTALGDEGYAALTGFKALKQEHLDLVVKVVRSKFDGSDPKAPSKTP